ncbi:MAG: DNA polymerase III subunit beta [Syntrophorhabdales bacterium]|jgi:DNA polymerase-3 subunit beta
MIIDRKELLEPMEKVVAISGRKSTLPVLANVLIELGSEGGRVTATDLSTTAIARINYKAENAATFLVHGDALHRLLKELDPGDIEISVNGSIEVKQRDARFTMAGQDPREFPEVTRTEDTRESVTIPASTVRRVLARTAYAVSHDESRLALTGLCLECRDGDLRAVGTDGIRLALQKETLEDKKDIQKVVIPRDALQDLRPLIAKDGEVLVKRLQRQVLFIGQDMTVATNVLDVPFPDYEAIVATSNKNIISVSREAFLKGLRKVMTIGAREPVKVTTRTEEIILYIEGEIGKAKETVSATFTGKGEIEAYFQPKYLLDLFSRTPDDTVLIEAPDTYGAHLFKGLNSPEYVTVLMPVRV